jgi:transposase
VTRARILLRADAGLTIEKISGELDICMSTIWGIRKRFIEGGLNAAINEGPRPGRTPKLNPEQTAQLIAVAKTSAPEGRPHWSLRLLAEKMSQLGFGKSICHETVRTILKKGRLEGEVKGRRSRPRGGLELMAHRP